MTPLRMTAIRTDAVRARLGNSEAEVIVGRPDDDARAQVILRIPLSRDRAIEVRRCPRPSSRFRFNMLIRFLDTASPDYSVLFSFRLQPWAARAIAHGLLHLDTGFPPSQITRAGYLGVLDLTTPPEEPR